MAIVTAVAEAIQASGETVTLRRFVPDGAGGRTPIDLAVKATVRLAGSSGAVVPLAGPAAEFGWQITITNLEIAAAGWPGPPKKRDQVVRDGITTITVDAVDTRKYGEDIVTHILYGTG